MKHSGIPVIRKRCRHDYSNNDVEELINYYFSDDCNVITHN